MHTVERKTISDFVKENKITIKVERVDENPNMVKDQWYYSASHYKTVLKMRRKRITIYFSKSIALTEEPTAEEILYSIALDSSIYLNDENFNDFCNAFGYDEYDNNSKKIYKAIIKQAEKAEKFLGYDLLNELVFHTELD